MGRKLFIIIVLLFALNEGFSQETQSKDYQLWMDFLYNYTFKNSIVYTAETELAFTIGEDERYRQISLNNIFRYNILSPYDVYWALYTSYEVPLDSTDSYNTFELRPWIGFRFNLIRPSKRVQFNILFRLEERFFFYSGDEENSQSTRLRIRPELFYALNNDNIHQNKTWFLRLDGEVFINLSDPKGERYAQTGRIRLGLNYRMSNAWSFEVLFMEQFSKNTIDETYYGSSNIFNLKARFFMSAHSESRDSFHE